MPMPYDKAVMQTLPVRGGRSARRTLRWLLLPGLLLAAACGSGPPARTPSPEAELPAAPPLPVAGASRYRIDPDASEMRILVYREGPLAEFGHNHVIVAGAVEGEVYLATPLRDSGFQVRIPVEALVVDPPAARAEEGGDFAKPLSGQARAATRENMLGPSVLDAERYPDIRVRSLGLHGPGWGPDLEVRITLRGVERDLTVPVALQRDGDRLAVTGLLELKQTDFGLVPFSAMGGGLRVADRIRVRFHLVAVRD
jgi:hypothetical protein